MSKPTELVQVNSLILDFDLYPRSSVDTTAIGYMVETLETGGELPPIVVDRKTRKVVDGAHRCRAHLRFHGAEAKIEVIWGTFKNDAEMFLESARLNACHGVKLNRHDRVHCAIRGKQLGISQKKLAEALRMTPKRFRELVEERTATLRGTSKEIPLKNTIKHKGGETLTKRQEQANKKLGGSHQLFFVNQLIELLEADLIDTENVKLLERLEQLWGLLDEFMPKKA